MPELPEVETIMQGMRPALEQQKILNVQVNRPDLRCPFPPLLKKTLTGRRIITLYRRAKYILLELEGGWTLLLHLGMSGRLFVDSSSKPIPKRKHEHFVIETANGARLGLVDPRRFGMVDLFKTGEHADYPPLARLGIEPLNPTELTPEHLGWTLRSTKTPIKNALLDQKRIVGLGNIYVCEILFRTAIHPAKPAMNVSYDQLADLCNVIPAVLREAIAAGGSTLRDYVTADGQKGSFQTLHQVYGREGEMCPLCMAREKRHIELLRITQSGRSTFFCPQHQLK